MKVNFMIIGAQKCGTTTLFHILDEHPHLRGCKEKEPHFFDRTNDWRSGIDGYHRLYDESENVLYFEGSTGTTFMPNRINSTVWESLYEYNPEMKFIYIIRNPFERIVSAWMHNYQRGWTDLDIVDAITKDKNYLDVSRYYSQMKPFIERFGRESVFICEFTELIKGKDNLLKKIATFLEIDYDLLPKKELAHKNKTIGGDLKGHQKFDRYRTPLKIVNRVSPKLHEAITGDRKRNNIEKPTLPTELKRQIAKELQDEIREIGKLIDKDISCWLDVEY